MHMFRQTEMKVFQTGKAENGMMITDEAVTKALSKGLFCDIPVILYRKEKTDYLKIYKQDEIIGVVKNIVDAHTNALIGEVIIWKDCSLEFEFKNYEIKVINYDKETNTVHEFTPMAVYIS